MQLFDFDITLWQI